jgi:peptidoglycan/LPS O-acetylase OafA/YrhL
VIGYIALFHGLNTDKEFIGDSWSFGSGPISHWEAWGRMMIEFGFGLLARKYLTKFASFRTWYWFVGSLVLAGLLFWSHSIFQGDTVYWTTYFAGPIFALVVFQTSKYNPNPEKFVGMGLTWLGKMSFGIYAFHVVILIEYDRIMSLPYIPATPGDPVWVNYLVTKIVVGSFISIVLAYWANRIVEKPIQSLGKRALKRL